MLHSRQHRHSGKPKCVHVYPGRVNFTFYGHAITYIHCMLNASEKDEIPTERHKKASQRQSDRYRRHGRKPYILKCIDIFINWK